MNLLRALGAALLAGACAMAFAGCGDDVPADAVAKVGDTVIDKAEFDHWLASAAKAQTQQGGPAVAPDPPEFAKCIAGLKKGQPTGAAAPKDADLKKQCQQSYDALKLQVMQFLLQSQWVQQEADHQGVSATDAEIQKLFADQKKQAFPKEKDYKKFLETSGATEADILFRIKLDALQNKLTAKVQKFAVEEIEDEDVEEYYEKNKKRFSQPARRDLLVVVAKTEARANKAKAELEGGATFKTVATKYSVDEASKANGGKLPAVAEGQQEKALDEAVFGAEPGQLSGPVKTQFGWYVFKVTKETAATQQSLKDTEETIRGLLKSEREQKALQTFIEDFRKKFVSRTECGKDFVVPECNNAPKPKTTTETTPATGAPAAPPAQSAPPAQPTP